MDDKSDQRGRPDDVILELLIMLYTSQLLCFYNIGLRDWSLITGRGGGATKREGGACEVLHLRKGGAEKVLAIL